jgi:hypothetical protein
MVYMGGAGRIFYAFVYPPNLQRTVEYGYTVPKSVEVKFALPSSSHPSPVKNSKNVPRGWCVRKLKPN